MLIDTILAQIAPYSCLGCDAEGRLLCPACAAVLATVPSCCYRCRRPTDAYEVCSVCHSQTLLDSVIPTTTYKSLGRSLVRRVKFGGARGGLREMAALMAPTIPPGAVLVPVPTATSRHRHRSYDHAVLLARHLAKYTKSSCAPVLRRRGQTEQVGASRIARHQQLYDAFYCTAPAALTGRHVVLIDDVLTTGATLEAAATALWLARPAQISAAVFARA